mgnify:CR=1 FL=1
MKNKQMFRKTLLLSSLAVLPALSNAQMALPIGSLDSLAGGAGGLDGVTSLFGDAYNMGSTAVLSTGLEAAQPVVSAALPYVGVGSSQGLPIATGVAGPLASSLLALQLSGTGLNALTALQNQDIEGFVAEGSKFPELIAGGLSGLDPSVLMKTAEAFDAEALISIAEDLAATASSEGLALPAGDLPVGELPLDSLPEVPFEIPSL